MVVSDSEKDDILCHQNLKGTSTELHQEPFISFTYMATDIIALYFNKSNKYSIYIYIPWPFHPFWGVADNTKKTTKTRGVLLRSSSNDEGHG